ncbi:MAG: hypothetical protein N3A00_03240 [Thermodesulfovibrio sp.]|nr:hypothetical protein [Thermodesulfovibrio sp.]
MKPIKFKGNCPRNVSRDAKYSIRSMGDKPVISIVYETNEGERWYPTTDEHPELIDLVRNVRAFFRQEPSGTFYINEYKQVILPVMGQRDYYYAGEYENPLIFKFEGLRISGQPLNFNGNSLQKGDEWIGPHQGIPYVLTAGGNDIKYRVELRPNVIREVKLSKVIGEDNARLIAKKICDVIGLRGGRFYVNEFGSIFTPRFDGSSIRYTYIGQLDFQFWFPKPQFQDKNGEIIIM